MPPNAEPVIAGRKPLLVTLAKKGDRVFWCACGRSENQPFCDGSHKGTGFSPVPHVAVRDDEEVLFCACKRTGAAPFCDGSHNGLDGGYAEADDAEIAATAGIAVTPRDGGAFGLARLDGGAFVLTPAPGDAEPRAGWRITRAVDAARGARFLSAFLLEAGPDAQALCFGGGEAVVFILEGTGVATIDGRDVDIAPECALTLRPGERFSMAPAARSVRAFACISPQTDGIEFPAGAERQSRADIGARLARVDARARRAMGARFHQVLADASTGAERMTLFIGEIPKSRAAAHRHLYEEAMVILSGEGFFRTEGARAAVRPGDVIYLPRKQLHTLECASADGMRLAGAFHPRGNPAVNY